MLTLVDRIGTWAARYSVNPPFRSYGLARTLLASATALTLLTNWNGALLTDRCATSVKLFSPLCQSGAEGLSRVVFLLVLLLVASGYRPRVTGLLHAWVTVSVWQALSVADGGDQLAACLTVLLVPLTLADGRKWHWPDASSSRAVDAGRPWLNVVAWSAWVAIRIQIAVVYLQSSVAKLLVNEWVDGTAVYYWLIRPDSGLPEWGRTILLPLLRSGFVVGAMTWLTIMIELGIAFMLVAPSRYWRPALWFGVALHVLIMVMMGLITFGMVMIAALVLYLRRPDRAAVTAGAM